MSYQNVEFQMFEKDGAWKHHIAGKKLMFGSPHAVEVSLHHGPVGPVDADPLWGQEHVVGPEVGVVAPGHLLHKLVEPVAGL